MPSFGSLWVRSEIPVQRREIQAYFDSPDNQRQDRKGVSILDRHNATSLGVKLVHYPPSITRDRIKYHLLRPTHNQCLSVYQLLQLTRVTRVARYRRSGRVSV
jgi:hypothetical protein